MNRRLALAMELIGKGSLEAITTAFSEIEADYRNEMNHPDIAFAVIRSMMIRAELTAIFSSEISTKIYDEIIQLDITKKTASIEAELASAMCNKGGKLRRIKQIRRRD